MSLVKAKAWLSSPRKWTKGSLFEGEDRFNAKCACALGACMIVAGGSFNTEYNDMVIALTDALPPEFMSVSQFNDSPNTTFEDIHALFDKAINS